jgi:hypothetical protein
VQDYNIPWDSPWTKVMLIGCLALGVFMLILAAVEREMAIVIPGVAGLIVGVVGLLRVRRLERRRDAGDSG